MKKKILLKGPLLTRSGYGEQSRFALRALRSREDLFDIFIQPLNWGNTSWLNESTEEREWIDRTINKTVAHVQQGGQIDIALQITIPNEWEKIAPVNIGYTAGIETTRVAGEWINRATLMDRIIVVSNHSRDVYKNTQHDGRNTETGQEITGYRVPPEIEISTVNYPVKTFKKLPKLDLELTTDFNFLCVAQFGPRKNLQDTLKWFLEEFHDDENVGFVLKANIARNSLIDRNRLYRDLQVTLDAGFPDRKCKIYLLHGDMTDEEMHALYKHPKIHAFTLLTHGEGFGLPIFEAAYSGIPVIVPGWSGQMDFLCDEKGGEHFYNVDYDVQPIPKEVVWDGVLIEDSMWANAREKSAKRLMRQCYKDFTGAESKTYKTACTKYATQLKKRFSADKLYEQFVSHIYEPDEEVEEWLSELEEMVNV
jgi:glycosyltransferase involved in cell wall biosynthesis